MAKVKNPIFNCNKIGPLNYTKRKDQSDGMTHNVKFDKKTKQEVSVSLSYEHAEYKPEIEKAFNGIHVKFIGDLRRFSAGELPMQIIIFLGGACVSGLFWDIIKAGIKKLYKKFKRVQITVRDRKYITYYVKKDFSVGAIVISDRKKEFEHIKTLDDLIAHMQRHETENIKNK